MQSVLLSPVVQRSCFYIDQAYRTAVSNDRNSQQLKVCMSKPPQNWQK